MVVPLHPRRVRLHRRGDRAVTALTWVAFGLAYVVFVLAVAGVCGFNDIEDDS